MRQAHNSSYRVAKTAQRTPTCDTCKSRHQKCSGEKPACSNCTLRGIKCLYTTFTGAAARPRISNEPGSSSAAADALSTRPTISEAEYNKLYSEIFGDIVRRLNLNKDGSSTLLPQDVILDARPGNASLPSFNFEVFSIVREQLSQGVGPSTSTSLSDTDPLNEASLEKSSDHIRKILRDKLPSENVALHLLDKFFDHQNSIFYVCSREEAKIQLALMYNETSSSSISWFCQMYLIFAVGGQYDDTYDTDGARYYEIGQKYIDDAVDESPQKTIWVVRAMLLLCFYQPPTKWNSVWMHLDAAIRGSQRFQLDTGNNTLNELTDTEFHEYRRLWFTVISFDRWVAVFLGRLPRIKESISKDPIFKDPEFRLEDIPQNHVTALAIISGNILRDMYFSENPSLNICRQRKGELESWLSRLTNPLQQFIKSGSFPDAPQDEAEAMFNLHFMHLGLWTLVTRPFLCRALRMNSSSNYGGPIQSVIISEANLCIGYASSLINSAISLLGSSVAPKRSVMPVFFLLHATYIMILAVVWKARQNNNAYGSPIVFGQSPELNSINSAVHVLEFSAQRNSFARRYLLQLKELRRQLTTSQSTETTPNSMPSASFIMSPTGSATGSEPVMENTTFQNLAISGEPDSAGTLGLSRTLGYSPNSPMNLNLESWQFGQIPNGEEGSIYDSLLSSTEYNPNTFWDRTEK